MGIIKGSVTLATPSAGNYQITMPESDLDIVGFAPTGYINGPTYQAPPIVGIYIDASNVGYFMLPLTSTNTVRKYTPVHVKLKGTVLNLIVPYYAAGGITIFYGVPDGNEIEYTSLKGVPFNIENTSTTANASGTETVTFPSGNVKITGILALGINAAAGQISFITGTGNILYLPVSDSPDPMDLPDNIYPLDLESATILSLNYEINYNSYGNAAIVGVFYYD